MHSRHLDSILSELELEYTFLDTKGVLCSRTTRRLRVGPKRDGTDAGPRPGKQMGRRVALVRQCCDAG